MSRPQASVYVTDLSLPEEIKNTLNNMLESAKDPFNIYTDGNIKQYIKDLVFGYEQQKVVGIVDAGLVPKEDEVVKEPKKDAILDNFLTGAQGVFAGSKQLEDLDINTPIVVRGIAKKKVMHIAIEDG